MNVIYTYKIENSSRAEYPFQLFKKTSKIDNNIEWVNMSLYVSLRDCVSTFLKELSSTELADEIYHGQASVDPTALLIKIEQGTFMISIYNDVHHNSFNSSFDVSFKDLIHRHKF